MNICRVFFITSVMVLSTSCSMLPTDLGGSGERGKVDYKKSRTVPSLEIPPSLSKNSIQDSLVIPGVGGTQTSLSDYDRKSVIEDITNAAVLPAHKNMRIEREGDRRWLVIDSSPQVVWPKMRQFWLEQGFLISVEDPRTGILETDWAENREDIPAGIIRNFLKSVADFAYSAPTRDKYRMRLEEGETGDSTEVFLSHRGVEEAVQEVGLSGGGSSIWRLRAPDPELEAEMLRRLMVFLGVGQDRAAQEVAVAETDLPKTRTLRNSTGQTVLLYVDDFPSAWRAVGLALDRVGFVVDDRNRSKGLYFVTYDDPFKSQSGDEGVLSNLMFWRDDDLKDSDQYLVRVLQDQDGSRIEVLNANEAVDLSSTAVRILTLLEEQLQ